MVIIYRERGDFYDDNSAQQVKRSGISLDRKPIIGGDSRLVVNSGS